jgi:fumarate reductase flavoprotein subunit
MEVPRGHIIQPDISAYAGTLEPVAENLGVEIMKGTPGVELIVQSDKTVLGVKAQEPSGKIINIQASKGVILAAGDTSGSKEFLLKNYVESLASIPACWSLNTADGIRMAMAVGADSSQKSLLTVPVLVEPHSSNVDSVILAKGMIYVDSAAKRFCNELDNTAPVLLNARDDKTVHILFSKDVADFTHRPAVVSDIAPDFFAGKANFIGPVFGGWGFGYLEDYLEGKAPIVQADTIEELAAQLDLDPAGLRATVDTWNNSVATGEDSEFGRPLGVTGRPGINDQFGATVAMLNPPYYALTSNKPALMCTEGPSLIIDQNMAVLDVCGNPIPKLYACGSGMTGGFPIIHLQHGEHAGFSLTSAYIAARAVTSA